MNVVSTISKITGRITAQEEKKGGNMDTFGRGDNIGKG